MAQNNRRGRSGRRRSGGQGNNPNRSIDSQGPEVKIRGNAQQVYDKYTALARDAFSNGDRIRAESLQQHAEHYYRVLQAMKPPEQKEQSRHDGDQQNQNSQNAQHGGQQNGHDQSGQARGEQDDADQSGQDAGERKPRRERRPRRSETPAEATDEREPAMADAPSDRAAVETLGNPAPEGAENTTGDDDAKPRRRRRTRRKAGEEDGDAPSGTAEEAPAV